MLKMRGMKELLLLIIGLVLFISDVGTDIFVAVRYKREGENFWFGLTLTFIIVPLFIVNVMAFVQIKSNRQGGRVQNSCVAYLIDNTCVGITPICLLFNMFIIDRYIQELIHWKQRYLDNSPCGGNNTECNCTDCKKYREIISESNESAYKLARLRYVETLLESTPQWCLQVYVMLTQWYFPCYSVFSTVISLLSLAWSNTSLEKARAKKDGHDLNLISTVLYFISQLAVLAARLISITTFAYGRKGRVFYILPIWSFSGTILLSLIFCGYMLVSICRGDKVCCEPSTNTVCKNFILSIPLTFYVSETALESLGFTAIWIKLFLFLTKSLENALLLGTARVEAVESVNQENFDILMKIAWPVVGIGFLFGLISLIVRHVLKRRVAPADLETNSTEAQRNAYHTPKSGTMSAKNSAFAMQCTNEAHLP